MKSFICNIPDDVKVIGFDMDGTIYDEFDFISQAYEAVSDVFTKYSGESKSYIYQLLCSEWLKYGSSANIFQNVSKIIDVSLSTQMLKECIEAFRTSPFTLKLSERAIHTFNFLLEQEYGLFLVTDGNSELQRRKFFALGLDNWFSNCNVAISGDYGKEFQKPNVFMSKRIELLKNNSASVLYLGDRTCDQKFAENCGFEFMYMKNMVI